MLGILLLSALSLSACAPKGAELYSRAESAVAKGDFRAAAIDLKNLVESEPENAQARALLGSSLLELGDVAGAEAQLKAAKDLAAPPAMTTVPFCRVMLAQRKFQDVLAQCLPESVPKAQHAILLVALGQALLGLERAEEARTKFAAASAEDPARLDAVVGQAIAARATGDITGALGVFDAAAASVRKSAGYWIEFAAFTLESGDAAAAELRFKNAIAIPGAGAEDKLRAMGGIADAQMRQGKFAAAEQTSEQLLKSAPTSPFAKLVRGQALAAAGKAEEARVSLEEVVSAQPGNLQARTLLGIVNLQQGNLGQAEMYLAAVVANQPEDVRAQRLLAGVRAQLQSPQAAIGAVQSALKQTGDDAALLAMAGRLSLANGQREQGLAYLAKAAAKQSGDGDPVVTLDVASAFVAAGEPERALEVLRAMTSGGIRRDSLLFLVLLQSGRSDEAIREARKLLERPGATPPVYNLVGGVYVAAGQPKLAREQFEQALKLEPGNAEALLALARLDLADGSSASAERKLNAILSSDAGNLTAALGAAAMADLRKDSASSEKLLKQARSENPDSVEAQLKVAQYYLAKRDVKKARAVLDEAAIKFPKNAAVLNARGVLESSTGDLPAAKASFESALSISPRFDEAATNLARAHLAANEPKPALSLLEAVLKANPTATTPMVLAATASLQLGQVDDASQYVAQLQRAAPAMSATSKLAGDVAVARKRYKEALELYAKADPRGQDRSVLLAKFRASEMAGVANPESELASWVSKHPDDLLSLAALADWHIRKGTSGAAIRLYEQGLAIAPTNAIFLNNAAGLYHASGDARALETATRAIAAAPTNAAVQDTYGWILLSKGKVTEAVDLLERASKAMPGAVSVQYHYGAALVKAGRSEEATPLLKAVLDGQLPPDERAAASELLRQITSAASVKQKDR